MAAVAKARERIQVAARSCRWTVVTSDFAGYAEFAAESLAMNKSSHDSSLPPARDLTGNRIDPPHAKQDAAVTESTAATRRRKRKAASVASNGASFAEQEGESSADMPLASSSEAVERFVDAPRYVVESSEPLADIVVQHIDDLSLHLAARLREVEERELALSEFHARFQEAEAAAQAWVSERERELMARERSVQLREEEVVTLAAAVAAAELAGDEDLAGRRRAMEQQERECEARLERCQQREQRAQAEQAALDQAAEKLRADRRREDETLRARRQVWQTQMEADRAQAERIASQLKRHRLALDERERALVEREHTIDRRVVSSPPAGSLLERRRAEVQAAHEHRVAAEHRWVAGQLWQRLVHSQLASDEQLGQSLQQLQDQLHQLYRRERESLEQLRRAVLEATAQGRGPSRRNQPQEPLHRGTPERTRSLPVVPCR